MKRRQKKIYDSYACLNIPGQDVKGGRRLIRRPQRYHNVVGMLNRKKVGVVALQESTAEARHVIKRQDRWDLHAATPNNSAGGVGNAIAYRNDRYIRVSAGEIRLHWNRAEHGFLAVPWVILKNKQTQQMVTVVSVHLPTPYVAPEHIRSDMRNKVAAFVKGKDRWVVMGDWNDGHSEQAFRRVGGRQVVRAHVDAVMAKHNFWHARLGGKKVITRGVMWRLSDHPMVIVKGLWK